MKHSSRQIRGGVLGGLFLAAFASSTTPALASTTFPEALRKKLGLAEIAGPAPGCRLCHQTDAGGIKTATKALSRSLQAAGVAGANVPSLLAGLEALEADGTDSDRDGVSDIDELEAGTDPNVALSDDGAPIAEDIPLPETGCALGAAPSTSGAWTALAASLWLLARRSSRQR
jgi:hypothetical protein